MNHSLDGIAGAVGAVPDAIRKAVSRESREEAAQAATVQGQGNGAAQVDAVLRDVNRALEANGTAFRFAKDDTTKQIVVSVLDDKSGKVIRQIPSEEQLSIAARFHEMVGVLFSQRV